MKSSGGGRANADDHGAYGRVGRSRRGRPERRARSCGAAKPALLPFSRNTPNAARERKKKKEKKVSCCERRPGSVPFAGVRVSGQSAAGQPERLELERWTDGWNASSGGSAVVSPIAATEPIEPSCGGALRTARPVAPSRGRWRKLRDRHGESAGKA
ncbi:hypothetical protein MTO96_012660 [Rhipicephalus appendiculatus]